MPHGPGCRAVCLLAVLLLLFGLSPPGLAQQIAYEYDALGRLILVSTPEGIAQYEYDAVGNILRIVTHKYADVSGPVTILGMSPSKGTPGTTVQLYGRGFGATPAENQVAFNGTTTPVTAATTTALTVTVPAGATTGPVGVTAPQGSATSPDPFTVVQTFAVSPGQADVVLGSAVGFRALLGGVVTTDVTWRVNGIVGGNAQLGTVTPTGVYTAPQTPPPVEPVPVEAVLTADPMQIATATVRISQSTGQMAAPAVTVAGAAALAGQIQAGPVTVAGAAAASAQSLSGPVTVAYAPALNAMASAGALTVTGGPVITGVNPTSGTPGGTLTLTLSGANLQGASAIQALWNGLGDTTLTASAVTPSADGTSASCTLTIGAAAPLGTRVLQVLTPQGRSTNFNVTLNVFTVSAP